MGYWVEVYSFLLSRSWFGFGLYIMLLFKIIPLNNANYYNPLDIVSLQDMKFAFSNIFIFNMLKIKIQNKQGCDSLFRTFLLALKNYLFLGFH